VNPVTLKLASGTVCTGGSNKSTCLIKLTNSAGPFGSCFAVASPAAAPTQNDAPVRTTPTAAAVTPPRLNSSQKSSQISRGNGPPSSTGNQEHKHEGSKKHKHEGSKKTKEETSKQQKSHKERDENIVKRDFTSLSRAMAERHTYIKRALAGQ